MKMIIRYSIFILLILSLVSCHRTTEKKIITVKPGMNEIADLNRYFVQKDRERIQNYIERKDLSMKESPTGLWYLIKNEGKGNLIKNNDRVIVNYKCYLLDGTLCYSSTDLGPKEFVMGKSEMEAGLNEGLRMMRPGAEAIFILPPFLAYGLIGDGNKIPSRSIIVYEISLKDTR